MPATGGELALCDAWRVLDWVHPGKPLQKVFRKTKSEDKDMNDAGKMNTPKSGKNTLTMLYHRQYF